MAAALTQGYTLDTRDNVGGVKEIYITELANVTAFSPSNLSGSIATISLSGSTTFYVANQISGGFFINLAK